MDSKADKLQKRREAYKKWIAGKSPEYCADRRAKKYERRRRVLAAIRLYKAERGCADCGERDPIVLELDHRDAKHKQFSLGNATLLDWTVDRILAEAAKCDVRCANCHRRKTAASHWRR